MITAPQLALTNGYGIFFEDGSDILGAMQYADHVNSVRGASIKQKPVLEARNCQTAQVLQFRIAKRARNTNSRHAGKRVSQILNGIFKAYRNSCHSLLRAGMRLRLECLSEREDEILSFAWIVDSILLSAWAMQDSAHLPRFHCF